MLENVIDLSLSQPSSIMIQPSVGRKVWYRPRGSMDADRFMTKAGDQPMDATIIAVWGLNCVNLLVVDSVGKSFPVLSAILRQSGEPEPLGSYAEWMPYQINQQKKAL